jgi:putative peptidoglycan lipid II flippase
VISLETLIAGALSANQRFASAAAAPILLNICMVGTLSFATLFPTAGHAAAWGVLAAGVLQALFVGVDAERSGFGLRLQMPKLDEPTRRFLKALGPAIVGAGGVQLALFADTIIATFLPAGSLSALYYADRINQLPIGVVGIASDRAVARNVAPARRRRARRRRHRSHARAVGALSRRDCDPELVMRALFARRFHHDRCDGAAATLAAYATGLCRSC